MKEIMKKLHEMEERLTTLENALTDQDDCTTYIQPMDHRKASPKDQPCTEGGNIDIGLVLENQMKREGSKVGLLLAGFNEHPGQPNFYLASTQADFEKEHVHIEEIDAIASAFSSPQRIAICAELLKGKSTSSELEKNSGLTGGQLYHHLKDLLNAHIVVQDSRGVYRLTTLGLREYMCMAVLARTRRNDLRHGRNIN